ncbi:hypothetical protein R5M92_16035 (plasmid) [Halomonas sp. Bachu 37]|uniref:hypothetical protein n=1 Tax=Halomonas kashgarensis TaxID=3084920 RepID=UPI0032169D7E
MSDTIMSKQKEKWDAWFESEGVSDDAFVSRDQPLERLKGSVREYVRPFDPVDAEDWEALDFEGATAMPRGNA